MDQDYFAKDFDPKSVTIKRLKEILNAHDISYKNVSRKAEFVQKFQEHVLPIVELQRRTEEKAKEDAELQQEKKTSKDHRRKSVRHAEEEKEEIIPSSSTVQTKKRKKSARASSKKQKEEIVSQQDDGQSSRSIAVDKDDNNNHAQPSLTSQTLENEQQTPITQQSTPRQNNSERLSPPHPLRAPTSPTPFYPMVPPYSRTPVYPFLEPEELEVVKRRDQELQQSSERQVAPPYSIQEESQYPQKGTEIKTVPGEDKTKNFERREAFAYCHRPQIPKRNIDRKPPLEYTKRNHRIRLSSGVFFFLFILMFGFLYFSIKTKIGFCDSVVPQMDYEEGEIIQPLAQFVVNMTCTLCPPKATCSNGVIVECEEGFKPETSLLRFTTPYYTHCAIDKDRTIKTKKYIKEFKEIIARENGRVDCGYEDKDILLNENLKLRLKEIMPPKDYEYINSSYENVLKDDDFYVQGDYVYSKKPIYGFYCQLSSFLIKLFQSIVFDNPIYSLAVVLTLFGIWYIRRWIWERRQVKIAFDLALMRLSEHKKIVGLQFREEAFAHVKDPMTRQKLFRKLDEKVRANPYVRAGNVRYEGFEAGSWEWKAPSTSIH